MAIEELRINETDLNSQRMLDLMAVSSTEGVMPLYLHTVTRILRELRLEQQSIGGLFEYGKFKRLLDKSPLTEGQLAPLQQRLDTLESFMNQSQAKSYQMGKTRRHASRNTGMYGAKGGNDWAPNVSSCSWLPRVGG